MPHREPDAHDAPRPDADTPAGGYDGRDHYCPATATVGGDTKSDAVDFAAATEIARVWAGSVGLGEFFPDVVALARAYLALTEKEAPNV